MGIPQGRSNNSHREAAFWEKYLSEETLSAAMSVVGVTGTAAQMRLQQLSSFHQALVRYENRGRSNNSHREAAFWEKYLSEETLSAAMSVVGVTGTAAQMKLQQLSSFHQALVRYENALLAIQNPVPNNMPGAGPRGQWQALARRDAIQAYDALVTEHRVAMTNLAPVVWQAKNRGGAISNAQRGITLALRSRGGKVDPRLLVADLLQAQTLKSFARFMSRMATPLALVTEGLIRNGRVRSVKQEDGDWHRESYKQMGGFALGSIAGGLAAGATFKAGKLLAAKYGIAIVGVGIGPIGWAVLGCIVVVSAGVALGVGKITGDFGEGFGDYLYNLKY